MNSILSKTGVLERIRRMDPYEFENLVGELWERQGYDVKVRKGSGDRGIDIEAYVKSDTSSSRKNLIQVKRYSSDNKIGSQQVREYATIYQQENNVNNVIIVTSGFFTDEARKLASDLRVDAINADRLFNLLEEHAPDLAIQYLNREKITDNKVSESAFDSAQSPFDLTKNWKQVNPNQTHFDFCPECNSQSVWFGKLNGIRHLKCDSCSSEWRKEDIEIENDGLIFSSTETVSGWREITGPNEDEFQLKSEWVGSQ